MSVLGKSVKVEQEFNGYENLASDNGMNYAIIAPEVYYNVDFDYFANDSPSFIARQNKQSKSPTTVKEGSSSPIIFI